MSAGTASATRSSPRTGWPARERSWPAPTLTRALPAPTTPRPVGWGPPRCIRSCAPGRRGSRSRRPSARTRRGKPDTVSGKDMFLHIANEYGDAANLNLEFGGPGLASMPMNDRRTIATQAAECRRTSHVRSRRGIHPVPRRAGSPDTPRPPGSRCHLSRRPAHRPRGARPVRGAAGHRQPNEQSVSRIDRQKVDQASSDRVRTVSSRTSDRRPDAGRQTVAAGSG